MKKYLENRIKELKHEQKKFNELTFYLSIRKKTREVYESASIKRKYLAEDLQDALNYFMQSTETQNVADNECKKESCSRCYGTGIMYVGGFDGIDEVPCLCTR